ncbi:hypothetical protein F5148DRAFT_1149727 [Russula earlei]|uniref:Uncharacterized protein n=1 Tax=Russula earlei TaxID=71964 RepID=A0ACC0U752_9AGAM|nr:hypothetical protein F5148DRAFT_1149727 [Russula earlei]
MAVRPDPGTRPITTPDLPPWTAPPTPILYVGRPPSAAGTARDDVGSTRPRLSQLLSASTPVISRPPGPFDPPPPDRAESRRTTSLARVALKYGISVTELRRANQLWASDSIHLRQVLYIPLDKAHHADLGTMASLLAQNADGEDADSRVGVPSRSTHLGRIPSASLSFFPPPTSRPSTPPSEARFASRLQPRSHSPAAVGAPSSRGPNAPSGGLRANALSSFFSILPINASTRDEIMSRLSMDSASNSTITGTPSDEADHELTAVPKVPSGKRIANASGSIPAPLATADSQRKSTARTWLSDSSTTPYGYREPYLRDVEQIALASSPIHTTQMQPAAAMQLPESMMTRSPPKGPPPSDPHDGAWRPSGGDHRRIRWREGRLKLVTGGDRSDMSRSQRLREIGTDFQTFGTPCGTLTHLARQSAPCRAPFGKEALASSSVTTSSSVASFLVGVSRLTPRELEGFLVEPPPGADRI